MVSLAQQVVTTRGSLGFSQDDLAEAAGVHRDTIAGVEGATRIPTAVTLVKLEKGLGLPAGSLVALALSDRARTDNGQAAVNPDDLQSRSSMSIQRPSSHGDTNSVDAALPGDNWPS